MSGVHPVTIAILMAVALIVLAVAVSVYSTTRDSFHPFIMGSAFIGIFHLAVFFREFHPYVVAVVCVLLVSLSIVFSVRPVHRKYFHFETPPSNERAVERSFHTSIWLISFPSLLAICYNIYLFDGFSSYMMAAKYATREFVGLGYPRVIANLISPISIIYWALYLKKVRPRYCRFLFYAHLAVTLGWLLLLFSRGSLMTHLLFMLLVYHYLVRPIKLLRVVAIGIAMILAASLLGVIRETLDFSSGGLSAASDSQGNWLKTEWTYAGLYPISVLIQSEVHDLKYGLTYATLFTNLIPRYYWPSKPPAGGQVFTEEYASGIYDEYSHFATTLFSEAWLNFGFVFGSIFAIILFFLVMSFVWKLYHRLTKTSNRIATDSGNEFLVILYIYTLWYSLALTVGEFTTVMQGYLTKVLVTCLYFYTCQPRRVKNYHFSR